MTEGTGIPRAFQLQIGAQPGLSHANSPNFRNWPYHP